jgi:PRC-barrel domain
MTAERRNVALRHRLIEVGSSRRMQRLSLSAVTTQMKGREAMPTFAASAQRALSVSRHGKAKPVVLVAFALLGAQAPASAATRDSQPLIRPLSWHLAQSAPASQPNAAAPARDDEKNKAEKAGVPATVVDGEQLESVLGIEALSSTGDDMGRIVDIIVDRGGQVRAAIIDFGGFLGVGSRKIAVDWRSLHFDPKKAGTVVVNLTKDQLRVAPVYKAAEPVVMIGGPAAKP